MGLGGNIMLLTNYFNDNLFDSFFNDFGKAARATAPLQMKTDIKESDEGFQLLIDLPGYKLEDVKAKLKDGYLVISAESATESENKDEDGKFIRRERYHGSCERSFYVGKTVKQEDIKASFRDGILNIGIPKKQQLPEPENTFIAIEG